MELKNIVALAIILGAKDIKQSSPGYILEKYNRAESDSNAEQMLDCGNKRIFDEYMKLWHVQIKEG